MTELTKQEEVEIKRLRKEAEKDYKMLNKVVAPELRIAHLERIIRYYNKIYRIKPPSITDKMTFNMIKLNYKGMCAMKRIRPQPDCI
jgi:hypothetical protein